MYKRQLIVLSKNTQNYFEKRYGRTTRFISNGVNRPVVCKADLIMKKFGLQKNGFFLYLGRIVPEKGLHYLVEAFEKVKTNKKLVIAGGVSDSGKYVKRVKELAEGDARIIFTGFVQGKLLEELYSNAYVYILPSDLEGMPLSLLEAMSYGNCCLVSDIAECIEVVEDKAVVFQQGNVTDLREKLQNLCANETYVKQYKDMAMEFICGKYNWNDVVEKTLKLYGE